MVAHQRSSTSFSAPLCSRCAAASGCARAIIMFHLRPSTLANQTGHHEKHHWLYPIRPFTSDLASPLHNFAFRCHLYGTLLPPFCRHSKSNCKKERQESIHKSVDTTSSPPHIFHSSRHRRAPSLYASAGCHLLHYSLKMLDKVRCTSVARQKIL